MAMRTEDLPIVRKYNVRCYRQSAVHGSWEQWADGRKIAIERKIVQLYAIFFACLLHVSACVLPDEHAPEKKRMKRKKERRRVRWDGEKGLRASRHPDLFQISPLLRIFFSLSILRLAFLFLLFLFSRSPTMNIIILETFAHDPPFIHATWFP